MSYLFQLEIIDACVNYIEILQTQLRRQIKSFNEQQQQCSSSSSSIASEEELSDNEENEENLMVLGMVNLDQDRGVDDGNVNTAGFRDALSRSRGKSCLSQRLR